MKVFVINGSPKGERSDTMKITRAFLKGLGEEAQVFETKSNPIGECLGCHCCWYRTPGVCVQKDAMATVLEAIEQSDLVIWSFPLYCYGMPSQVKAVADRLMPLSTPKQYVNKEGKTCHVTSKSHLARHMLISGCGFPQYEHNFEPLVMQFGFCFGAGFPRITTLECPLLGIEAAKSLADGYLGLVYKAGLEYKQNSAISEETQKALDKPMFDPETYRSMINAGSKA